MLDDGVKAVEAIYRRYQVRIGTERSKKLC